MAHFPSQSEQDWWVLLLGVTSHYPHGNRDTSMCMCSQPQPRHAHWKCQASLSNDHPPHRDKHNVVPWHIPQPSSSLESGQSGCPSQSHVCGMQVLLSGHWNSPVLQGCLLQLGKFLLIPLWQSSMLSQEQRLPVGGGHCPSWAHGSISAVQGRSGPKCPHNRAQLLFTAHPPTIPAFQGQRKL